MPPAETGQAARLAALESLARENATQIAGIGAKQDDSRDAIEQLRGDVREARDGVNRLSTVIKEQGVVERITKLQGDTEKWIEGLRSDIVNATTKARSEAQELVKELRREFDAERQATDKRLRSLETDRERRQGGFILIRLVKEWAPVLVALGIGLLAFLDKAPHH